MRRSHVEMRSRKYAARQYVSETHDHKPDAPTRPVRVQHPQPVRFDPAKLFRGAAKVLR